MRTAIFRWKAIVPLVLFLALLVGTWSLWGDRWLRAGITAGGTAALGARVELKRAHLGLSSGQLTLRGLVVASPNDSFQNLFQADELTADLALLPLLEKKVVIDPLAPIRPSGRSAPRSTVCSSARRSIRRRRCCCGCVAPSRPISRSSMTPAAR